MVAGLDTPSVQTASRSRQTLNIKRESAYIFKQTNKQKTRVTLASKHQRGSIKLAHRGENMQGFQLFPAMEQRDTQRNLFRVHTPVPFKLLKELKAAYAQYGSMAFFTQTLLENMSLEVLPTGDWKCLAKA